MGVMKILFPKKKLKEPVFMKESNTLQEQVEYLESIKDKCTVEDQENIEKDLRLLKYGLTGEKNIEFELKNIHMPLVILHDIYLQYEGLSAQIDYVIIARKATYIVECKNLWGNIKVTEDGAFERTIPLSKGRYIKEGIYSPVTQNKRHMDLIKQMKPKIARFSFHTFTKSVIVLANPKTILNTKEAPKSIKDQIIRCDQLISYIADQEKSNKELESGDEEMMKISEFYQKNHIEIDWKKQYLKYEHANTIQTNEDKTITSTYDEKMRERLKGYRLQKSKAEGMKPYIIFTNAEMEALIERRPDSLNAIKEISGFGDLKVSKYGLDILKIFNENEN